MRDAERATSVWIRFGPAWLIVISFAASILAYILAVGDYLRQNTIEASPHDTYFVVVEPWAWLATALLVAAPVIVQTAIAFLRRGRAVTALAWGQAIVNAATFVTLAIATWVPLNAPLTGYEYLNGLSLLISRLASVSFLLLIALVLIGRFTRKR